MAFVTLLMIGFFSVRSYNLHVEGKEYQEKKESLEKKLVKEQERAEALEEEEKYRNTMKYIEDYAHNQLGLVYPDEIIFKTVE